MRFRYKWPKNKIYKKYKVDFWGTIAHSYKQTKIAAYLLYYAEKIIRNFLYKFKKPKQRKFLYSIFSKRLARSVFQKFSFEIKSKARAKEKKPLTFHGRMLELRRKLLIFYTDRYRRKPLRKYTWIARFGRTQTFLFSFGPQKILYFNEKRSFTSYFETRLDVLLFRSLFTSSMYEARQLVRHRKMVIGNGIKKGGKLKFKIPYLHYTSLSPFVVFSLVHSLRIKRKFYLIKELYSFRILNYPSNYLLVNFVTMYAFRLPMISEKYVTYPFSSRVDISFFGAIARYF